MPGNRRVRGVIMAGGRSERMRATHGPAHKALVEVAGLPLIEHNLLALFAVGVTDVVVVHSNCEPEIEAYLHERGAALASRLDARLQTFVEHEPLGNIGVVGALNDGESDALVIYVDNLTSISATELLTRHRQAAAALTIATHLWPLQNPFGELEIEAGFVRAYREKPVRRVRISSGTCVVSPEAAAFVPPNRPFGAADLFAAVLAAGLPIAAYEHDELWIDVNDARTLEQAEHLIRSNRTRFAS